MSEDSGGNSSLRSAFFWVALSYVLACGAACVTAYFLRGHHPLVMVAGADVAGTVVIFLFSYFFDNSSFYDPYWSVAPIVIVAYFIFVVAEPTAPVMRQILAGGLTVFWGLRLTGNWIRGWQGLGHEDWRYVDLRAKNGRLYWLVSFMGVMMFPTVLVFMGCMALYPALVLEGNPFGPLDIVAALVTAFAVWMELYSDIQLHRFRRTNTEPGKIMNEGLWAYSRHPNYFGEVLFWWGLFLFALAADVTYWWTGAGALAISILFIAVSIPMLDERHLKSRAAYADHMKRVSALVPWFPRKP